MQNIVILAGNIGAEPESRSTQGGTNITSFRLATSRPRYADGKALRDDQGRRLQDTEWHRITAFNGLGKTVQAHCTTGMKVLVRGRIHYTEWNDQQGVKRYGCEIIAETIDFLSRGRPAQDNGGDAGSGSYDTDDDIPF
ncbi:single-stranded DNA-binding protein [Sphingopyxis indica]|uniref:single-stranded DNA-binding protein n=1 Tax=Sphingopyxis indica TaxID=436663 RepID=UPI0029394A88|nr:single-stranded DNA-binding protein [Sphingopyxis indica]MEA3390350.1 single-stranded DNA-binding protein [Pseudomonadota bacterium]WOF43352.1 single-stranded DNA-binding protein [Sphingopyxis indica]